MHPTGSRETLEAVSLGGVRIMNLKAKILSILMLGVLGLNFPVVASASNFPWGKVKAERDEVKSATKPAEKNKLRDFLGKKAAIGTCKVTAKSGTSLTCTKGDKTYTILTDDKTKFERRFWGKSSYAEISVNDQINVIGKWADSAKTQIQAKLIRNLSVMKRKGVFFGTVDALTSTGWTMKTIERGTQTVTVDASAKFINRKEQPITKADVLVGHRVRVRGVWDATNHTITEVTEVKDFDLPVKTSPSPSPTPTAT